MPHTTLNHTTVLVAEPQLLAAPLAILEAGTTLEYTAEQQGFYQTTINNQQGFVPLALCAGLAAPPSNRGLVAISVQQPVVLYQQPVPGGHFAANPQTTDYWMLRPTEPVGLLGTGAQFALIQRPDGMLGYVPSILIGMGNAEGLTGFAFWLWWILLGFGGLLMQWIGLASLLSALPLPPLVRGAVALGLLLVTAVLLWFGRRREGKPVAVGALAAYGLMFLVSEGSAVLWR